MKKKLMVGATGLASALLLFGGGGALETGTGSPLSILCIIAGVIGIFLSAAVALDQEGK